MWVNSTSEPDVILQQGALFRRAAQVWCQGEVVEQEVDGAEV